MELIVHSISTNRRNDFETAGSLLPNTFLTPALLPDPKGEEVVRVQKDREDLIRLQTIVDILDKRVERLDQRQFLMLSAFIAGAATIVGALVAIALK